MLGMSAGEERSASGGGGWANLASLFVFRRRRRSGSQPVQMLSFSGSDR